MLLFRLAGAALAALFVLLVLEAGKGGKRS